MNRNKFSRKGQGAQVEDPLVCGYFWGDIFIDDSIDPGLEDKEAREAYLSGLFDFELDEDE